MTEETLEKGNRLFSRITIAKSNIEAFRKAHIINVVVSEYSREADSDLEVIAESIKEIGGKMLAAHLKKLEAQLKAL